MELIDRCEIFGLQVRGVEIDPNTRCAHWHGPTDVIAIKFPCCDTFYCCNECHQALADHPPAVWSKSECNVRAVLCGACGHVLTIREYMACNSRCPNCAANFNPGCRNHWTLYFEQ